MTDNSGIVFSIGGPGVLPPELVPEIMKAYHARIAARAAQSGISEEEAQREIDRLDALEHEHAMRARVPDLLRAADLEPGGSVPLAVFAGRQLALALDPNDVAGLVGVFGHDSYPWAARRTLAESIFRASRPQRSPLDVCRALKRSPRLEESPARDRLLFAGIAVMTLVLPELPDARAADLRRELEIVSPLLDERVAAIGEDLLLRKDVEPAAVLQVLRDVERGLASPARPVAAERGRWDGPPSKEELRYAAELRDQARRFEAGKAAHPFLEAPPAWGSSFRPHVSRLRHGLLSETIVAAHDERATPAVANLRAEIGERASLSRHYRIEKARD